MRRRSYGFALLVGLLLALEGHAQVRYPEPPKSYEATIHYRIRAGRNDRIRQFTSMQDFFDSLGFQEQPTEDSEQAPFDADVEYMLGTIPGPKAPKLLIDPRVMSILLIPEGAPQLATTDRAKVRIELQTGFPLGRQRDLWFQVRQRLELLGYQDGIGYDHRRFTQLRGNIAYGTLPDLLLDIRTLPGGWLIPDNSYAILQEPLQSEPRAIRIVEMLVDPADAPMGTMPAPLAPPVPADLPELAKQSPELRMLLADETRLGTPLRVEVIFNATVNMTERGWRGILLDAIPNMSIEGQVGPIVTILFPQASMVNQISRLPQLIHLRLPRSGAPALQAPTLPVPKGNDPKEGALPPPAPDVLASSRVGQLQQLGWRGENVRVAIIDTDFTDYEKYLGKGLPRKVKYIDLTAERNFTLLPDPLTTVGMGHGTHMALGVALAAPAADLTLIRVDGSAPHQVQSIARATTGALQLTEALSIRFAELEQDSEFIRQRRVIAQAAYERALANFGDDEESRAAREKARNDIDEITRIEQEFAARVVRFNRLRTELENLQGMQVVICPLSWNTGLPIDGMSAFSRELEDIFGSKRTFFRGSPNKVTKTPAWFQAAGDTRGQAWMGLFQDRDLNGVMEFSPEANTPLPPQRWTPELNFLGFQGPDLRCLPDLPANTRLRIAIQWREPHHPELPDPNDEFYRRPLADLQLLLLRQRDPDGKQLPSDELELIAFSQQSATRLLKVREGAVFEQVIEVTLPAGGRYAVRVEGRVPKSVWPSSLPSIPALDREWELRPRVFIESMDAETLMRGRPVFVDFTGTPTGMGVPADSQGANTVGAADILNRPQPYSAFGAGPGLDLLYKPRVLAYDQLPRLGNGTGPAKGTSLATAFAGGTAACLISAGAPQSWLLDAVGIPPGHVFIIPDAWLRPRR